MYVSPPRFLGYMTTVCMQTWAGIHEDEDDDDEDGDKDDDNDDDDDDNDDNVTIPVLIPGTCQASGQQGFRPEKNFTSGFLQATARAGKPSHLKWKKITISYTNPRYLREKKIRPEKNSPLAFRQHFSLLWQKGNQAFSSEQLKKMRLNFLSFGSIKDPQWGFLIIICWSKKDDHH